MPVGKLDTAGRVTAEPCAAPLRPGTDGKCAFAGMHDAHKLRHRRHAATSDTSAKRRRYESCPSPVAASGLVERGGRRSPVAPGPVSTS